MEIPFMTSWLMLIFLTLLQGLAGLGLISLFRIKLKPGMMGALWMIAGVAVFSLVPFLLQLLYIPLTSFNIFLALIIACLLLNAGYKRSLDNLKYVFRESRVRVQLYEIPFLVVMIVIVLISVWRCFYFPPTPRDLTSGAEVIAEYAIKEKTMLNSVFTVNLETTNNQFKPPFIASLQVIYKYAGFYFGQLWLSTIFISFIVFLSHLLGKTLHRLLASLLLVAFIAIPEMYAYTFMVLFDYSNTVFFCLACYFLFEYLKNGEGSYIRLAGFWMGIAIYTRSETLVLACMLAAVILWHYFRKWNGWRPLITSLAWLLAPAVFFYILSITIYINYYLPASYNVEGLVNTDLLNLRPLVTRFMAINERLIFSSQGITYYGYFFFLFLLVLLSDLILFRKLNAVARNWLFAVLVIYLGMPVLGYLLPLLDIDNSSKRGLFKIFPLMLLYMGNSSALLWISDRLKVWERNERNGPQSAQ